MNDPLIKLGPGGDFVRDIDLDEPTHEHEGGSLRSVLLAGLVCAALVALGIIITYSPAPDSAEATTHAEAQP